MYNNKIRQPNVIIVPKLVKKVLRHTKVNELKAISENTERSKELIYLMSSQLIKSYQLAIKNEKNIKINLNAEILKKNVGSKYKEVVTFLIDKNIIHCDESYREQHYSKKYWLTDQAIKKGLTTVQLKDTYLLKRLNFRHEKMLEKANENVIANYLIYVYNYTTLPTAEQLLEVGKKMVKNKTKNKKGKLYKLLGHKSKESFKGKNNIRFIEDDIKLFQSLTANGLSIPRITGYKAGGRVVCSIALTPSWIREHILIDNEETVELDFSALHPNIANLIWGENINSISHDHVANELGIERKMAKIKHLSLFNYDYFAFQNSELSEYYRKNHLKLYNNILNQKQEDFYNGKKKTVTYKLFKKEVELMSKVVEAFQKEGIKALYVYDAMRVKLSDKERAIEIMNQVAHQMGVLTTAA